MEGRSDGGNQLEGRSDGGRSDGGNQLEGRSDGGTISWRGDQMGGIFPETGAVCREPYDSAGDGDPRFLLQPLGTTRKKSVLLEKKPIVC